MLLIQGKAIGQRRPLFDGFSLPPPEDPGDGGPLKLRDLITHVVVQEVAAFEQRRERRRLDHVLSPKQIEQGELKGRISPEGRDPKLPSPARIDPSDAVQTALEAFTDGLYLVVIDDIEYRDLEAIVRLGPDSRLTFVRLTFLAGA